MDAPLLRAPPFAGLDATISRRGIAPLNEVPDSAAIDRLFDAIRAARVGGSFWAPPAKRTDALVIVRTRSASEVEPLLAGLDLDARAAALVVPRGGESDPWSLLHDGLTLLAHGDDEWLALGVIIGCKVQVLSAGRFGVPGADRAAQRSRIAADLLHARYRDPYSGAETDIAATIALLAEWRRTFAANHGIVAGCGFSWWKRREIARFLWMPGQPLRFFRSERRALDYAAGQGGAVAVWPSRVSETMVAEAAALGVALIRVEDGFVRSVGLGSNLVPPSSVTVDRRGIHYDPARASDLEHLLAHAEFPPDLLARASRLRETIVRAGISKYASGGAHVFPERIAGKRLVLVPGQVADDMSVRLGGAGLTSNLELLQRARALEPDAEIWFRPHPDVDAGHRVGAVRDADALLHADRVVRGGGMAALLDIVDAVHVLTSLSGFEALLRGRDVTCHGVPFYAGWGLTRDLAAVPDRRGRLLTLDALVAGVLIAYPRYLDPVSGLPCAPEILIRRMEAGAAHNRLGWITRLKQVQGRLMKSRT